MTAPRRPSGTPGGPTLASCVLALLVALTASTAAPGSLALATDQESVGATITTDILNPPTGLTCNGGTTVCNAGLATRPALSWTATPDPYAMGYSVFRSTTSASGYVQIGTVTGRTTTTFTDTTGGLSLLTTYYYVVRSTSTSWMSVNSNQVRVTIALGLGLAIESLGDEVGGDRGHGRVDRRARPSCPPGSWPPPGCGTISGSPG